MYEFSVYSLNTSHEYFIPYIPLSNSSYLEEQYCMQVRQHITIHKATKQIWYTVSKSHICNAVLLLPHTHTHTHTHTNITMGATRKCTEHDIVEELILATENDIHLKSWTCPY